MRWLFVMAVVVGCSSASNRHDGTIALCAPEDLSVGYVLAIHSQDARDRAIERVLIPISSAGERGSSVSVGARARCLGGVGKYVLVQSDGYHLRDPRTGAVVAHERELFGSVTELRSYDAATHRANYSTGSGVMIMDVLTREKWREGEAPLPASIAEGTPTISPILNRLARGFSHTPFYGGGDPKYGMGVAVGIYGLACDDADCRLGTRTIDGYGNGTSLTPIEHADTIHASQMLIVIPSVGLLTQTDKLDLTLIGYDGKVRWKQRGKVADATDGWVVDGKNVLLASRESESAPPNHTPRTSFFLVDIATGAVVWTEVIERNTNWWDQDLEIAAVRTIDGVIVGANANVVARPIGPGDARWRIGP